MIELSPAQFKNLTPELKTQLNQGLITAKDIPGDTAPAAAPAAVASEPAPASSPEPFIGPMMPYLPKYTYFEDLGSFEKDYEREQIGEVIQQNKFIVARLDGRSFHAFTRMYTKPFDAGISNAMSAVAGDLLDEFHADLAYTQSDEITLVWKAKTGESQHPFGGKIHKLTSLLAAHCSMQFNKRIGFSKDATFDCRVWGDDYVDGVITNLHWRHLDAVRNSINMVAYSEFPPSKLDRVSSQDRISMLWQKGISLEKFKSRDIFGAFITKQYITTTISDEVWAKIPQAKKPASREFTRKVSQELVIPSCSKEDLTEQLSQYL